MRQPLHLASIDHALAWLDRCGVTGLATDSRRVQPGGGLGGGGVVQQGHAQKLSGSVGPGLAVICALTSMSGATFIMRSVCCTT